MNILHDIYNNLLADVSFRSGFSEVRGSWWNLQWVLNEAPKLDKHVLRCVETYSNIDLDKFPIQLRRLARRSLVDPLCMRYLRQLLLFCYKAEVDYTDTQLKSAFAQFEQTNREVGVCANEFSRSSPTLLNQVRRLCHSVLYKAKFKGIIPKHGPGASTTPKEVWSCIFSTIESVYPFSDYFCTYGADATDAWDSARHDDTIDAKLIAVPKDSRGPRLICVHPAEAVWIQQGVRLELERVISLSRQGAIWPRGHIHFDDQTVNGKIALLSSRSGKYATLDLKEASDRISDVLIQAVFGRYYKYFGCCRAQNYVVDGVSRPLHCYAPMGNATTSPVQSLLFWAICVSSLSRQGCNNPNSVFVFGDDILVPSEYTQGVIDDLHSFGLLVNKDKTFWQGAFRESCGVDAFNGVNVTPLRWKTRLIPNTLESLQSLSDLAMRFRMAGYVESAYTAYRYLGILLALRGKRLFSTNNPNHGSLAEYVERCTEVFPSAYWHSGLHKYISPVYRVETVAAIAATHDRNHVLESVCSLERTHRSNVPSRLAPRRVRLKRGWTDVIIN